MKAFLLTFVLGGQIFASTVDLKKSTFAWQGTKVTGKHYGQIALKSASLKKGKSGRITAGEFVIDMNTVTITDLDGEWGQKFIQHIKSDDFFSVKKFPKAKLIIASDDGKNLTGQLTIKGKTNKVKIPYTVKKGVYSGTMTFDRTKFDMKYGSGSFFKGLGDKMIHDKVTLKFNVKTK